MAVPSDQQPWSRFLDDSPIIPVPRQRFYPTTLADLVEIVKQAEASGPPIPPVRAVGSHWAPCEAAVNRDGFIVESKDPPPNSTHPDSGFNQTLYDVVGNDGCLTAEALRFFGSQEGAGPFDPTTPPKRVDGLDVGFQPFFLGHFEAGTRIYEAYDRLDRGFDDPRSLCALPGFANYLGPWALGTMGGAGGQTLGGAISTGVHGGDIFLSPIADSVQALHIVGVGGKQYWIDRNLPDGSRLTSNSKLLAKYGGDLEIHHDDEFLDAAMVSVGRFGIIYSVVLRVVRQFALAQVTNQDPTTGTTSSDPFTWPQVKPWIAKVGETFKDKRFLQVIINPNGRSDDLKTHSAFVTFRDTRPLSDAMPNGATPNGRDARSGQFAGNSNSYQSSDFNNLICDNASSKELEHWFDPIATVIHDLVHAAKTAFLIEAGIAVAQLPTSPLTLLILAAIADAAADDNALRKVLEFARDHDIAKGLADDLDGVLVTTGILDDVITHRDGRTLGGMVAELCNRFVAADRVEYCRFLSEMMIKSVGRPGDLTAISYAVMDGHSYLDDGCTTKGVSLEAFMDADGDVVGQLVESIFRALDQLQAGSLLRANGQKLAYAGVMALRFMKASRGLIAMQQDEITCSLELEGLGGCNGNQIFMEEITAIATGLGARMHWGQFNDSVDFDAIQSAYGARLERWRAILSKLSHNGRVTTFSTPFTMKKGLEVVKPEIGKLSVVPRFAVAGEMGLAAWDAFDNPDGTTAVLTITPVGGRSTSIEDLELRQVVQVPFVVGEEDVTLDLGYLFSGRPQVSTETATATVRIRGFDASDPDWTHQQVAVLADRTGVSQFGVSLTFVADTWSPRLRVEMIFVEFEVDESDVRWTLHGPVAIDREFSSAASNQVFLDRPHLVQDFDSEWLFVHQRLGQGPGTGPPPTLKVRFRLGSDPLAPP